MAALALSLVACGPKKVDRDALATRVAATVYAEQTAQVRAFTPTPTNTPEPTPTATPLPPTPEPTPTDTPLPPTPTDTPLPPTPTPTPTPGGGRIAFTRVEDTDGDGRITADDDSEIYVMNAYGSGQTNLTNTPAYDGSPAWSPDGTRIAFDSVRDDPAPFFCSDNCNDEIYVMNADGSGQTNLTNNPAGDSWPSWGP